ncbi:ATP-binding cassette domain-containing protein [Kitasatospora sp. NPDC058190]|uniref:ATP-binding cassette domain-containing protein n=1 Tax=Kitasatospora sp. NPDC058190 TaxID=3346371 RepID=UPI0036DD0ECB
MIWPRRKPRPDIQPSASELRLFGARFGYDFGFTRHESAAADATLRRVARQIPAMLVLAWRLAWRADRRALVGVVCAEVGRAAFAAVALVATNRVLAELLAGATVTRSLHRALVPLLVAGAATGAASWLSSASTWAAAVLEPQVERITTLTLLRHADSVELAALEDAEFARTLESARFGADSVRRLISEAVSVLGAVLTMTATAGVILSLNVALLPMLVLIALPRAWGAVRTARRRHASVMAWLQHARASNLICQQVTAPQNAAELRVHGVGRWLLECYEEMARTSERERRRLAGAAAATSAGASAASGAASLATFALLGWLVLSHRLPMAGAVTVIVGIRSGAATVGTLLTGVNRMFEESLYVRDLERLGTAAGERAIPAGGADLPQRPAEIRLEKVTFTYPGRTSPSLSSVSLVIPRGKVVALVGVNGAGKSTLAKLLVGLYQPDEGRILWDDVDTRTADRRQLFASCVLFAQDFVRWPFTIRANTTAGRPEHAEDGQALQGAADFAGLEPLLRAAERLGHHGGQGLHRRRRAVRRPVAEDRNRPLGLPVLHHRPRREAPAPGDRRRADLRARPGRRDRRIRPHPLTGRTRHDGGPDHPPPGRQRRRRPDLRPRRRRARRTGYPRPAHGQRAGPGPARARQLPHRLPAPGPPVRQHPAAWTAPPPYPRPGLTARQGRPADNDARPAQPDHSS